MSKDYEQAGVSVVAGNELVDRIKPKLGSNRSSDLLSIPGGFAALSKVPAKFKNPVMALSTDGVGTKIDLLRKRNQLHTVGQDLVAMCANDVLVYGAEPTSFLDYYATGKLNVDEAETVITSIADACDIAGCTLVGGETAEMPGFYPFNKFDLAGFCVGWVEQDEILDPRNVQPGDVLIGLRSSGFHSNGYSLIRKVLSEWSWEAPPEVMDEFLQPTRIYVKSILPVRKYLRSMAHITGGGLRDNLPRAFPKNLEAHIEDRWALPKGIIWLWHELKTSDIELYSTFNVGIGMVLIVDPEFADDVIAKLEQAGETAVRMGRMQVRDTKPRARSKPLIVAHDRFEFT